MVDTRQNHKVMERDSKGHFVRKKPASPTGRFLDRYGPPLHELPSYLKPLGTLPVRIFGEEIVLTGGPYKAKPGSMFGVKMAAEIDHEHDVSIPTRDFSVPDRFDMLTGMLGAVASYFVHGDAIYVGCMGGKGRTGLFMATLAYLCGEDEPVKYVRKHYYAHAVETREQEQFVTSFDRAEFRRMLMKLLMQYNAVTWSRLRRMPLQDKLLWLKLVFAK